jgi:hypothetical protein
MRTTITTGAALTAVLVVAGCGGANNPQSSTNAGGGGPKDGVQAAYRFSACMRSHGVSNFPDPIVHSSGNSQSVGIKVDPSETNSPRFKSAQQACQHIMPAPSPAQQAAQQRAHGQHLLAFARCMRAHGVTSFPDPNAQGDIRPEMLTAAGVDLHSPAVQHAAFTCVPSSGGVVTAAAVRSAISGGH